MKILDIIISNKPEDEDPSKLRKCKSDIDLLLLEIEHYTKWGDPKIRDFAEEMRSLVTNTLIPALKNKVNFLIDKSSFKMVEAKWQVQEPRRRRKKLDAEK